MMEGWRRFGDTEEFGRVNKTPRVNTAILLRS